MPAKRELKLPSFLSKKLKEEINEILNDYQSGSQEINEKILQVLLKVNSVKKIKLLIELFKLNFDTFQIVQNTMKWLENSIEKENIENIKSKIRRRLHSYQTKINKIFRQIRKHLKPSIKILTISNSKTIFDLIFLIHTKNYSPEVFVLTSLPGGEGRVMYQKLKSYGISSHLVEDNKMKKFVNEADIVLVGADKILPGKWFINKVKTKKLVTIAKSFGKKVFLVSLKEKVMKENELNSYSKTEKDFNQYRTDKNLFEKIDLSLIDEIFIA